MTSITTRYINLLINKTNLIVTGVVLALMLTGYFFGFMTAGRAVFLFVIYISFMIIYHGINARFISEESYQIFNTQGHSALGNPIPHCSQTGRIIHYLLIGGIFSIALGASDADPAAFFRGFSSLGLLYAGIYGLFNEMTIKRQAKAKQDDSKK